MTATLCKAGGLGVILPIGEIVGKWPRSAVVKREGVEISPPSHGEGETAPPNAATDRSYWQNVNGLLSPPLARGGKLIVELTQYDTLDFCSQQPTKRPSSRARLSAPRRFVGDPKKLERPEV